MAAHDAKGHEYHLVDPSPWPIIGAISAFVLALGFLRFMHFHSTWLLGIGVIMVLYTMFVWWRDVDRKSVV